MNTNHPANNVERKGDYLENKNIWVGVTGSVSCVETVGIVRELLRYGAKVTIVANRAALVTLAPYLRSSRTIPTVSTQDTDPVTPTQMFLFSR
jgi:phosphopantothenoylcysteine synthetase/decarboxylase